jgi:alginate O-acetyltransferase complex protein AlgI
MAAVPLVIGTFLLVTLTWVPFRAESFAASLHLLCLMLGLQTGGGESSMRLIEAATTGVLTIALVAGHSLLRDTSLEDLASATPWWAKSLLLALMILAIVKAPGEKNAFIYFQF